MLFFVADFWQFTPAENKRMSPKRGLWFNRTYIFQLMIFTGDVDDPGAYLGQL